MIGIVILSILSVFMSYYHKQMSLEQENRYQSYLLADQLRQSSDDLTRMARTYVVTQNPKYEKIYQTILAIRNGKFPRPQYYERIYWDFVLNDGDKPRPDVETKALISLMKEAGFSEEEFSKLREAQKHSDQLAETEMVAINSVKNNKDNPTKQEMAIRIMHDQQYHEYKAHIMRPIDEFFVLLDERTKNRVTHYQGRAKLFLEGIQFTAFGLMIITIMIGISVVHKVFYQVGGEPEKVAEIAQRIAQGDIFFDTGPRQTGLYASLQEMQTQLRARMEQNQRITEEALRISSALDSATTSVLIADKQRKIIYTNQSAQQLFSKRQEMIRQVLPDFDASQLIGSSIDKFHTHPNRQNELLENLTTTHTLAVNIGELHVNVKVNPVINAEGHHLGWVAEFLDHTAEVMTEQEVNAVMMAASLGEFDRRINLMDKSGFFKTFSQQLNQTLDYAQKMIEELRMVFTGLAHGDWTQSITHHYIGSLELLKNDVNTTITTLTEVMNTVKQSTQVVKKVADEISQGNANLSHRTEEQAISLESATESIKEMTEAVKRNSEHAQAAKTLAEQASIYALRGGSAVHSVEQAMKKVHCSSQKMSDALSLINDIAFQTNLLSLNASVEAARAGEHGRGFAVVAGEVRNLSQRSTYASKEIKELIEDNIREINEGTHLVIQSGMTLQDITKAVTKVSEIVVDIATESLEQINKIQHVNTVINHLDQMTLQNATLVEEAAIASRSLKEQAKMLKEQLGFFKTKEMI